MRRSGTGSCRVDARDCPPDFRLESRQGGRRAKRDVVAPVTRPLKRRVEQHGLDLCAAIPIARVADDSDDLNLGAAHPDAPADGPGAAEEGPHRRFVHQADARRALDVRKADRLPAQQPHPHRLDETGTDGVHQDRPVRAVDGERGPGGQAGGKRILDQCGRIGPPEERSGARGRRDRCVAVRRA